MNEMFELEKKHLSDTISIFNRILDETNIKIKTIPKMYQDNPVLLDSLLTHFEHRIKILEKTKTKPYFARIDFKDLSDNALYKCYIGKIGLLDEFDNIITVDWRAPIASVYYDSNIGLASYKSPAGLINGELLVKRQYEIENQKLLSMQDIDTVFNDEILKPYLGVSADNRLKNIVASIQSEQNTIIREDVSKNIIIQGVAGSGKTTVALHRIAYLVYNNRDIIDAKNYLVIGPNKFFVNYISSVLPDLDVHDVKQLTYDEILEKLINKKIVLLKCVPTKDEEDFLKYKLSMNNKKSIDLFLKDFENSIIPKEDISIHGYTIIPNNIIRKLYNEVSNSKVIKYDVFSQKINRVCLLIKKYLKDNYSGIANNISKDHIRLMDNNNYKKVMKEVNSGLPNTLKKYFSSYKPNILKLYATYLSSIKDFPNELTNHTIKNINSNKIAFEDLPSLIYLYYRFYGSSIFSNIRHAVIDEAQDFGNFSFYSLKCLMPKCNFSIFGDLAQSIYSYRGLTNWEDVIKNVFDNNAQIEYLLKSYRTTTEIMNEANKIINYVGLKPALPVIRHGENVHYYNNREIYNILNIYKNKKYESIAIICKNEDELYSLYRELSKNIDINILSDIDTEYSGGICMLTCFLAKGLEFDAVIIYNASQTNYDPNNYNDMKLLYVAMTRSLHELSIIANNNLTKVLSKIDNN